MQNLYYYIYPIYIIIKEIGVESTDSAQTFINIYLRYIIISDLMKRVDLNTKKKIVVDGIVGYMERKVTKFGTGAKVDCPKEYLGRTVYLVIV